MSNQFSAYPHSESELNIQTFEAMSKAAIDLQAAQQDEPLTNDLRDLIKERDEMKLKISKLEASENQLRNQVETLILKNEKLVDKVENYEMELAEIKKVKFVFSPILDIFLQQLRGQSLASQESVKSEKEIEKRSDELEKLSAQLGALGGADHYFGNDKTSVRSNMKEEDLRQVLRLLSLGEKRINFKEKELSFFLFLGWGGEAGGREFVRL